MSGGGRGNGEDDTPMPRYGRPLPMPPRGWEELARGYADLATMLVSKVDGYGQDMAETKAAALIASAAAQRSEENSRRTMAAVEQLERRINGDEIEHRAARAVSSHDLESQVSSERIKEIVDAKLTKAEREELKADHDRSLKTREHVIAGLIIGIVMLLVGLIVQVLTTRSASGHPATGSSSAVH